jgi:uncharacterized membrane protein
MTAVHEWLGDLALAGAWALLAAGAILSGVEGPVRVLLLLPMVVFVPGYALVSTLFPRGRHELGGIQTIRRRKTTHQGVAESAGDQSGTITTGERFVLAVGFSLAFVPLITLVLNFTPYGISTRYTALALTGSTLALALLAAVRRGFVDFDERYRPLGRPFALDLGPIAGNRTYGVLFAGSLLVLAMSGAFAGYADPANEPFTEYYLVTESGGNYTADGVGDVARSGGTVYVTIENHEGETVEYTTVAALERVGPDGEVTDVRVLDSRQTTVEAGATAREEFSAPGASGDGVRLAFYLYLGDAPENPSRESAYRVVHVWLTQPTGGQADLAAPAVVS